MYYIKLSCLMLIPLHFPSLIIALAIANQGRLNSPEVDRAVSALGIFLRKLPVAVTTAKAVVAGACVFATGMQTPG